MDVDTQNIPFDVSPDDPEVIAKLVDITKQTLRKITELQEKITEINKRLFE